MSFMETLVRAIAAQTAAEHAELVQYSEAGAYSGPRVGLYDTVLPETPDDAIALTVYPLVDNVSEGDAVFGAQFRFRASSKSRLYELEEALRDSWARRPGGTLGTVRLVQSVWSSGASLGQDANGRLIRSANYYLTVHRPSMHDNI